MPLRPAESFLNEYRGRRNDGRISNEEHLTFLRSVQQDAAAAEREALLQRIVALSGGQTIPGWLLQAVAAPIALPVPAAAAPAPVQPTVLHIQAPMGVAGAG